MVVLGCNCKVCQVGYVGERSCYIVNFIGDSIMGNVVVIIVVVENRVVILGEFSYILV